MFPTFNICSELYFYLYLVPYNKMNKRHSNVYRAHGCLKLTIANLFDIVLYCLVLYYTLASAGESMKTIMPAGSLFAYLFILSNMFHTRVT